MTPQYELHRGDCLKVLRTLASESVDAVVCDPPYEIAFMQRGWDKTGIAFNVEVWREALRVLKPGGHLLAFSATRTYHRMVCAIEDAGFEIRDQLGWVYGSGFPKSLDVSKAIDKAAGAEREVIGPPTRHGGGTNSVYAQDAWTKANQATMGAKTAPATDAAREWEGWGTALKPAWEPIVMARKPMIGTTVENVLAHGTGALNIDACRVPTDDKLGGGAENLKPRDHAEAWDRPWKQDAEATAAHSATVRANVAKAEELGRWPANLLHDGSDEVVALFPDSDGSGPARALKRGTRSEGDGFRGMADLPGELRDAGTGSAARFFYCAKPSRRDRNEGLASSDKPAVSTNATMHDRQTADWSARNGNYHPTVKPTALMRWLCRLVTPPGGTVLDFFTGSGSTGKGSVLEGFNFVGCERDEDDDGKPLGYLEIARARIEWALEHGDGDVDQPAPGTKAERPAKAKTTKVAKPKKAANDESPGAEQGDLFGAAA